MIKKMQQWGENVMFGDLTWGGRDMGGMGGQPDAHAHAHALHPTQPPFDTNTSTLI